LPLVDAVTAARFRHVFGHFCTGVTVITAMDDGRPAGFACQAFAALSLEPPLAVFCPSKKSATWRVIERSGHFAANVLAVAQQDVARVFGSSGGDKFAGLRWTACATGDPVLEGVLAWAACEVEAVHDGGDHQVVIGRVIELGEVSTGDPLLFYRGRFGLDAELSAWPAPADWI
jgi:3-hydroxy-9,10-secoandrosta-1,3,5(10)-triene-9,17-dione monooxygenase reductase component